ncbi:MAG: SRPBCC family protein [Saprospiraceae bacterium]|nr:SRPBCC family protein [Saprospiraceae bacterium]
MNTEVSISSVFECSLERAFKTPLLCDVSKVHTGYGIMPKVTHCTEDEGWGKPGSSKKVHVVKSLTQKGGFASVDRILERAENQYWLFQVDQFQSWILGFDRFTGKWTVTELAPNRVRVDYQFTLHSTVPWLYPLNWLFARLFWQNYMRHVLENIRNLAYRKEPYMYA